MSKCVNFFRRFFLVFLTCVVTVISMAVAISPPVSAVGVFSPFNFYQLYQMLHGLLLGDGGGNSQTFGEWLEENMTQTIGSGNDKHTFLLTPGMKLEDMMSEASVRLALGAACTDGGAAGMLKIKHLIDSWTEVYDTSDIGEIGESGGSSGFTPGALSSDGKIFRLSASASYSVPQLLWSGNVIGSDGVASTIDSSISLCSTASGDSDCYLILKEGSLYCISRYNKTIKYFFKCTGQWSIDLYSGNGYYHFSDNSTSYAYQYSVNSPFTFHGTNVLPYFLSCAGINLVDIGSDSVRDYFLNISNVEFSDIGVSDDFIGPVYAMPAAKQLITDTGTLSGLRLDVQTEDGTPDISAALDHAGVDTVNDLVSGVASGTIPMSQVYEDMRVVPYVLTDVETGEVVTDLGVSATDAKTKAVALDKDLSIPKDISAVDAYQVTGKTWDPSLSKYKLPLFNFFPFCLPYDAYQFLTMLDVAPVAPVFHVDTTPLFSHTKFFHASDGYKITLDLTKYEEIFQILRAGECLAIVVGLCLISYKLIHGGD